MFRNLLKAPDVAAEREFERANVLGKRERYLAKPCKAGRAEEPLAAILRGPGGGGEMEFDAETRRWIERGSGRIFEDLNGIPVLV